MTSILHPPAFVETGGSCDGPNYTRNQPSRETPGIIMNEIDDKYISEFELPYINVKRYAKEIKNNLNRLSEEQKKSMAYELGLLLDSGSNNNNTRTTEFFGAENDPTATPTRAPNPNLSGCVNYFKFSTNKEDSVKDIEELFNVLLKPTADQKTLYSISDEIISRNRNAFYNWFLRNYTSISCDWQTGINSVVFLIIIVLIILGLSCGSCIN